MSKFLSVITWWIPSTCAHTHTRAHTQVKGKKPRRELYHSLPQIIYLHILSFPNTPSNIPEADKARYFLCNSRSKAIPSSGSHHLLDTYRHNKLPSTKTTHGKNQSWYLWPKPVCYLYFLQLSQTLDSVIHHRRVIRGKDTRMIQPILSDTLGPGQATVTEDTELTSQACPKITPAAPAHYQRANP